MTTPSPFTRTRPRAPSFLRTVPAVPSAADEPAAENTTDLPAPPSADFGPLFTLLKLFLVTILATVFIVIAVIWSIWVIAGLVILLAPLFRGRR